MLLPPVRALAIDPKNTTTLYAVTDGTMNTFKSTDGGRTWLPTGLSSGPADGLAIDPSTPTTLYAAVPGGVLKSTDGGATWSGVDFPGLPVFDPKNPMTLYAGALKSTDGGETWNATGLPAGLFVDPLVIDPKNPMTLYVGAYPCVNCDLGASVYRSTDGGDTWSTVVTGLPSDVFWITALAVDPINPTTLYLGMEVCRGPTHSLCDGGGLFKTTDSGDTWDAARAGLPSDATVFGPLAIDPVTPTTLYISVQRWMGGGGVFKSTDGGGTWQATDLVAQYLPGCGDGLLGCGGEECDDGNQVNGDGCDNNCKVTRCGNGIVTDGEECDDGNTRSGDGCTATCRREFCGDAVVQRGIGEECDDANQVNGDGCDNNCKVTRCGNGVVTAGEECDDGNSNSNDGCTNACTICGNRVVTPPETCDDGNLVGGDGCGPGCTSGVVGTGAAASCTEAALDQALSAGTVTFHCGTQPVTITVKSEKTITGTTTLGGGGLITLSGGGTVRVFRVEPGATLNVRNLTIANGKADDGGGIYNAGAVTLTNCTLRDNAADNSGGAIFNGGTLTVTNSTLNGNTAGDGGGGGLFNQGTANLTNCALSDNSAHTGGAIFNGFVLTVANSTLNGNTAGDGGGGALFNQGGASLTNCTLSENAHGPGVAIVSYYYCGWGCSGGEVTLTNTIIVDSAGASCSAQPGSITDGGHNLQWPGTSCGATIPSLDPQLDPAGLKDNGGPTQTIALLPDSPTLDAGDNDHCPATDQRGVPRPYGAACDIGAYERTLCGNGILDPGEQCDDGNLNPFDGCTTTCTLCGNGVITPPEQCDDGNLVNGDACEADCTLSGCGNGILDCGEQCDDGNTVDGDGCDSNCTPTRCGNGVVTAGEQCDDGNTVDGDACEADCTLPGCGNGIVDLGEQCDDGNRNPFDGCTNDCTVCGDGKVTAPEECDGGTAPNASDCDTQCRRPHAVGTGTPASCTEAAFEAALAERSVIFNCGPAPVTITLTRAKAIDVATTIDGGDRITLSGGGVVPVFIVSAALDVRNLTIAGGRATNGGGIANSGILVVTNCTFSGNSAQGFGGAIDNEGAATLTSSTFSANNAPTGGGIANRSSGTLRVTNSTFSRNVASWDGGGINNFYGGTTTVTNSTFLWNVAAHSGGGITNVQDAAGCGAGGIAVTNCTFLGNSAGAGAGGIDSSCAGSATVTNTILQGYTDASCVAVTDGGHNLQFPGTSCGTTIPSLDPLLNPAGLKDNGGPTQTIALLPGSPAINAGDAAVCANPPVNGADQRGFVRPGTGSTNCSIGAYEFNSFRPSVTCVGDCAGDGDVTIDELLTMVNIALGNSALSECQAGDARGDRAITIDEIIAAVNVALNGCGV
jgi:cysteine-rich repeat protein